MMIRQLSVVTTFIDELNESIKTLNPPARLTFSQRNWLRVVLIGIVVTGMLNRAALGIAHVHEVKDKVSGGYFQGRELIFLVMVTDTVTFPVGFCFYRPDGLA